MPAINKRKITLLGLLFSIGLVLASCIQTDGRFDDFSNSKMNDFSGTDYMSSKESSSIAMFEAEEPTAGIVSEEPHFISLRGALALTNTGDLYRIELLDDALIFSHVDSDVCELFKGSGAFGEFGATYQKEDGSYWCLESSGPQAINTDLSNEYRMSGHDLLIDKSNNLYHINVSEDGAVYESKLQFIANQAKEAAALNLSDGTHYIILNMQDVLLHLNPDGAIEEIDQEVRSFYTNIASRNSLGVQLAYQTADHKLYFSPIFIPLYEDPAMLPQPVSENIIFFSSAANASITGGNLLFLTAGLELHSIAQNGNIFYQEVPKEIHLDHVISVSAIALDDPDSELLKYTVIYYFLTDSGTIEYYQMPS